MALIGHQYCIAAKPAPADTSPPDRLSTNTVVHMLFLN